MKTICITGSQGFIGSYICSELLEHNYKVIGIDNYSKYGYVIRPHDDHPNFTLYRGDVTNIQHILDLQDMHLYCIVACAAMIGGISYFHKYAYDLLATNERILASTFDYAIGMFTEDKLEKIIVLSSSMVFENTNIYPTPESALKKTPPPLSTYGFQKLSSEYFCKGAHEQYGLPFVIIRPFNCIGIGEGEMKTDEKVIQGNIKILMSHVVPDLIYKTFMVGRDGRLPILGMGNQVRHYTYGGDIARGVRLAMECPIAVGDDFNISSDRAISVKDLATIIWRLIHGNAELIFEHCEPYQYDVQMRSPDTTKARNVLQFSCLRSLEDILKEIIQWMRKQYGF